ncbi:MAG TPA: DinB family protein [Candidatus Limnocylindrales bacterium]|nr:DinB family protein [Candidatus Limnocylindrales bacterium]
MGQLDADARRLETATVALVALEPRIRAGAPWPMAEVFGAEPEASWGPPELLAHVSEFLPYWLGEIERILDRPAGEPVPFGRLQTDSVRIGLIGRERTLPLRELFSRIQSDTDRVARRLRELTDAEVNRVGVHPTRGDLKVKDMLEPFLAGHLEGHVTQLREILAAAGV